MARNTLQVSATGNLARDPRRFDSEAGRERTLFTIAVNQSVWDPATRAQVDQAAFIDVTWFGALARACAASLTKGQKVLVVGRMAIRPPREHQGRHYNDLEIAASEVEFLSPAPRRRRRGGRVRSRARGGRRRLGPGRALLASRLAAPAP